MRFAHQLARRLSRCSWLFSGIPTRPTQCHPSIPANTTLTLRKAELWVGYGAQARGYRGARQYLCLLLVPRLGGDSSIFRCDGILRVATDSSLPNTSKGNTATDSRTLSLYVHAENPSDPLSRACSPAPSRVEIACR